jgi:polysaccharide deacetylase family protein (PEP-CTERM system associated)
MTFQNAFTVDVEDYFQVSAFEKDIDRRRWGQWDTRVVANTQRILDLLERHGVRATFFVLGWVARNHPQLVREIHKAGHEIGSHSYWHRLVYELSPEEFRHDLQCSRNILEDTIGRRVTAYRAPSFSITKRSLWALDILIEEGFVLDSSIVPASHDRYGIPDAEPRLHRVQTASGSLWEFPPPVIRFSRLRIPVGGGGYFRLYPLRWSLRWLSAFSRQYSQPFVFYVHPWELDPEQPRLRLGSRLSRVRHYLNLASTAGKLDALLRHFRFGPMSAAIPHEQVVCPTVSPTPTVGARF